MNLFQLVFKQMRQRSLSTWLTMLSVTLGVALAIAIFIFRNEGGAIFGQRDYGYDVLIGAKGSPLQLVLNTVYLIDKSPGNIPYSVYNDLRTKREYRANIRTIVPFALGDSYKGHRIIGVTPKYFGFNEETGATLEGWDEHGKLRDGFVLREPGREPDAGAKVAAETFQYRVGKRFELAEGRMYHPRKFEAVIGSEIGRLTGLKLGDTFHPTHGMPVPGQAEDVHDEKWTVVGVLAPTHTAADKGLYIPLLTFYCIAEHESALEQIAKLRGEAPATAPAHHEHDEPYEVDKDGLITLKTPEAELKLSGIMVRSRGGQQGMELMWRINNRDEAAAVNPASVMREFFQNFIDNIALLLLVISILVTVVAGVGILVSIYNSISARTREIAILRALGATRGKVLTIICTEAGLIGLFGSIAGLIAGHLIAGAGSKVLERTMGEGIAWLAISPEQWIYCLLVVGLALLAGLVPALKAYRTPVATNLVGS